MSHAATAQDDTEDRYYTQVDAGDVRLFTLDQLDAAFNVDLIHENTYVCLEGDSRWLTLGEVAGLAEEPAEEAPEPPPPPLPAEAPLYRAAAAPSYATPPSSAPYSVAPMMMPPSMAPAMNDLSFDDLDSDILAMRPKRRGGKVAVGLLLLALGAVGFMVVQSGARLPKLPFAQLAATTLSLSKAGESGASQAIVSPKAVEPVKAVEPAKAAEATSAVEPLKAEAPAEEAPNAPAAVASSPPVADGKAEAAKSQGRFSEEMQQALLNKDKKQSAGQKRKKAARIAAPSRRAKSATSSTGFKSGGSAYDPLNGKL